ncbi:hypothetical protein PF005_g17043 [Phytophthora fragariae]|uniref:Uncharacterized protein n=1 Tax=Phytophthora fragariae TaxID=53985 RepID=A0A6A3X4D3_9STRA|nr:hypothetical protein PF005_g17043 [Phytophthora fragariae]
MVLVLGDKAQTRCVTIRGQHPIDFGATGSGVGTFSAASSDNARGDAAVNGAGARHSGARAELISGLPSKNGSRCDVGNLETLRYTAIVYTWVNGTENCYNKRRQRAGLPTGSSSRDKEMVELKYWLHSLLKFALWLEGPIYIVTPGQIPAGHVQPARARGGPGRPAAQVTARALQGQHRGLAQHTVHDGSTGGNPASAGSRSPPPAGRSCPAACTQQLRRPSCCSHSRRGRP